jgi:protein-disulfide isomerase
MRKLSLGAITNIVLILVALVMGASVLRTPGTVAAPPDRPRPTVPGNWEQELVTGISQGPEDAPIKIIEFMDFQCPFCRSWSHRVDSLVSEYPEFVRVTFQHRPLTRIHPHALSAAVAAECADEQGRFHEFARVVFADQALIGLREWSVFADSAGVPDVASFDACILRPAETFARIQHSIRLSDQNHINGTPTIWLNGISASPTTSLDDLRKIAQEAERRSRKEH